MRVLVNTSKIVLDEGMQEASQFYRSVTSRGLDDERVLSGLVMNSECNAFTSQSNQEDIREVQWAQMSLQRHGNDT